MSIMSEHKNLKERVKQSIIDIKTMTEILTKVTSSIAKTHAIKQGDQGR